MPEPTVCMPADQIAGSITFLSIGIVCLAVFLGTDVVINLFRTKKKKRK